MDGVAGHCHQRTGGLCLCVSHRCHWLRAGGTEDMKGLEILKEETFIIEPSWLKVCTQIVDQNLKFSMELMK